MSVKSKRAPSDEAQSKVFIETAKRLEVEESGRTFERAFNAVMNKKSEKKKKR
jgi:hypothetical protein